MAILVQGCQNKINREIKAKGRNQDGQMTHSQMTHQLLKKGGREGSRIREIATSKGLESVQDLNYKEQTEKDRQPVMGKKGITSYPMVRFLRFPSKSLTDAARSIETSSNFISLKTILESPKYSRMSTNCPNCSATDRGVGWVQSDVSKCKEKTRKLEETTKMLSRSMGTRRRR